MRASVAISKSANTAGATSASRRRHSMASRRISTSACSLADGTEVATSPLATEA
ncbi:hypothetical protein MAHJHV55_54820 [Mycobacterium avium subsp. hominissuis]